MDEYDTKTYLLSIASYPDGTTALAIDSFDGHSLYTSMSSLNILGTELTNMKIVNAPSILDDGTINLTVDTPVVIPFFGRYYVNLPFSFRDGYLIPDDSMSASLITMGQFTYITARDIEVYNDIYCDTTSTLPAGSQVVGTRLIRTESTMLLEADHSGYIDLMPASSDPIFESVPE